jgi:hypothetical protein
MERSYGLGFREKPAAQNRGPVDELIGQEIERAALAICGLSSPHACPFASIPRTWPSE